MQPGEKEGFSGLQGRLCGLTVLTIRGLVLWRTREGEVGWCEVRIYIHSQEVGSNGTIGSRVWWVLEGNGWGRSKTLGGTKTSHQMALTVE